MRIIIYLLLLTSNVFALEFNHEEWVYRAIEDGGIYFKKKNEKIPTLCFHKIGDEERYALTSESFEEFLIYLNNNNFYLLSDREYIEEDLSQVPTGYKPIVLGSDDASEGNFIYKTLGDIEGGEIVYENNKPVIDKSSMVYLLEKHIKPVNGRINFTFYVSYNGVPFRQTGGLLLNSDYSGNEIIKNKFLYLHDKFIIGNHTYSHLVTKDITPKEFERELDKFYDLMFSYIGKKALDIDTLAYPYGCHQLPKPMEEMLKNYNYRGAKVVGGFDFNGYFARSPFNSTVNKYDISRIGVDNKNIKSIYKFLETIPLYKSERVFVVKEDSDLTSWNIVEEDLIEELK